MEIQMMVNIDKAMNVFSTQACESVLVMWHWHQTITVLMLFIRLDDLTVFQIGENEKKDKEDTLLKLEPFFRITGSLLQKNVDVFFFSKSFFIF